MVLQSPVLCKDESLRRPPSRGSVGLRFVIHTWPQMRELPQASEFGGKHIQKIACGPAHAGTPRGVRIGSNP